LEIAQILRKLDLTEFDDFGWSNSFDKELAIVYGNCHMGVMAEYLRGNAEFDRNFEIRYYDVSKIEANGIPSENELCHCKVLITQDIRSTNELVCPSARELIGKTSENCKKIIVPNLHGCNMFYPQVKEHYCRLGDHINENAIDAYTISNQDFWIKTQVGWVIGLRDENMYMDGKMWMK
jgi:hypothetical protein